MRILKTIKTYFLTLAFLLLVNPTQAQLIIPIDSLINNNLVTSYSGIINSEYGREIVKGDFNGDGIEDMAIGSPNIRDEIAPDEFAEGRVTIIYGETNFDFNTAERTIIRYYNSNDRFSEIGQYLGSGDLNNDGIDDVMIGSPSSLNHKGKFFVLYGRNNLSDITITNLDQMDAADGFYLNGLTERPETGPGSGSRLGTGFDVGDFNNDGVNDLAVSAPRSGTSFDQSKGFSYLIYGQTIADKLTIGLDTLSENSGIVFYASNGSDGTGSFITFEDLNGDDIDELMLAAPNAWSQGRIYAFQGQIFRVNFDSLDVSTFSRNQGFNVRGSFSPTKTKFGEELETGDVNGDGFVDLIVSAPSYQGQGRIYVIYGTDVGSPGLFENINVSFLNPDEGFTITGQPGKYIGTFSTVADFDKDGFDDIAFNSGVVEGDRDSYYGVNSVYVVKGTDKILSNDFSLESPDSALSFIEIRQDSTTEINMGFGITAVDLDNDSNIDLTFGNWGFSNTSPDETHSISLIKNPSSLFVNDNIIENPFAGGSGTEQDPYLISTPEELIAVRDFPDAHFKQINDIDLVAYSDTTDNKIGWVPIGYAWEDKFLLGDKESFTGSYDGDFNLIKNMYVNSWGTTKGLFYNINGDVKNITLVDSEISYFSPANIPDSVKSSPSEIIENENPRFSGTLSAIVGESGSVELVQVRNSNLENGNIGGLIGQNNGTINFVSAINTNINNSLSAGGICNQNFGTIEQAQAETSIFNSEDVAGGICASQFSGSITESAVVKAEIDSVNFYGGIVGILIQGEVQNSYANYVIKSTSSVGGIIGTLGLAAIVNSDSEVFIKNNYSWGKREIEASVNNYNKGIVGLMFASSEDDSLFIEQNITNNYWNSDRIGEIDTVINTYIFQDGGLKSWQMKKQAFFENWDYTTIWSIDEDSSFPYLQNVNTSEKPGESIPTSSEDEPAVPKQTILHQNYPNPFNPSTVISFTLSEPSNVQLDVFDMLGKKVATIISNKRYGSGNTSVEFNAGNLASGIYIYRLKTNSTMLTKKLTLIK